MDEKTLKEWAKELGFGRISLCHANDFNLTRSLVHDQPEIAERRQLRYVPREEYPEIKSLAVLLWPYLPAAMAKDDEVFVDSYYEASNAAYHAARELERRLCEAGRFAKANVSYPAREAAVRAGLGIIGRSSMLITPEYGTRVVIILMATDIPVEREIIGDQGCCLQCGRCAQACPSGAIDENGMTHPERCLRNFMMEGIIVPESIRHRMGMTLIGCDLCQRVCPMQRQQERTKKENTVTLRDLLTEDADTFRMTVDRLGERIGRNTARPQRVRAQAALLAGNYSDPEYLTVLAKWSESPFPAVREHAIWSIAQIRNDRNTDAGA